MKTRDFCETQLRYCEQSLRGSVATEAISSPLTPSTGSGQAPPSPQRGEEEKTNPTRSPRGEEKKGERKKNPATLRQREVPPFYKGGLGGITGFTLVEILIAIALATLLIAAIYSVYNVFYRQASCQELKLEAQQNARAAIELMQKELLLAGLNVPTSVNAVEQGGSSITFRYMDPMENNVQTVVTYEASVDGKTLNRRKCTGSWLCAGTSAVLIEKLQSFALKYYGADGMVTLDNAKVRFVGINLSVNPEAACVGRALAESRAEIKTEVRLRNREIETGKSDSIPPAKPITLKVREDGYGARVGICGRLRLRWDKGTDADLSYYTVYYTNAAGTQGAVRVNLSSLTDLGAQYEYVLSPGVDAQGNLLLAYTASGTGVPATYRIGIRAFDASHNGSLLLEVPDATDPSMGNPNPSRGPATFGSGENDTNVNPSKPAAVTGFSGVDGPNDGKVALSWAYDAAANPDVVGFRVYRSDAAYSTYPIAHSSAIAGETGFTVEKTLASDKRGYIDIGPNLVGCRPYYYAIAPVSCDTTLITDNDIIENGALTKYVLGDYGITYGDGAEPGVDVPPGTPGGSDTAPPDTKGIGSGVPNYPYPTLSASAGWKRVSMGLTNPKLTGDAPVDPDFSHTYIAFNKRPSGDGCNPAVNCAFDCCYPVDIDKTGNVTLTLGSGGTGGIIPNAVPSTNVNGKFTTPGANANFFVSSETLRSAIPPTLSNICPYGVNPQNPCTYYFKAISFDMCGNKSSVAVPAQILSTLCGDDPTAPGSPGVPQNLTISGCTDARLHWDDLSTVIDFAGYAVYRNTTSVAPPAESSLNISGVDNTYVLNYPNPYWPDPANCPWGCGKPYREDTTTLAGQTYYYFVRSMDCAYANDPLGDSSVPLDGVYIDFPNSISAPAMAPAGIIPFTPGKITRDEKCSSGGACVKDGHREVVTGVTLNGSGVSSPKADFIHNTVTLFFENTSAGGMTITGADVSWVNSEAFIRGITVGGGRSGVGAVTTNIAASRTGGSAPYAWNLSNIALSPVTITGLSRYVPITFEFQNSAGLPIDMRTDQLLIKLNVTNNSSGTTSCRSYLVDLTSTTADPDFGGIAVPFGPSVTLMRQNSPIDPTSSYAIPGPDGANPLADIPKPAGNVAVKVSSNISSNTVHGVSGSRVNIASAKLFYVVNAGNAPPAAGYTEAVMTKSDGITPCSGFNTTTTCSYSIPPKNGQRVWYYVVAEDEDGNYAVSPEPVIVAGVLKQNAYVYDQKTFTVCDVWPSKPTGLTAVKAGVGPWTITLNWNAVTTYNNDPANPIGASDPITYVISKYKNGALVSTIDTLSSNVTYVDNIPLLGDGVYSYTVAAKNSCPNIGLASNPAATCVGSYSNGNITPSPATEIKAGESYTVTIYDCLAATSGNENVVNYINSALLGTIAGVGSYKNTSINTGEVYSLPIDIVENAGGVPSPATATFGPVTVTTKNREGLLMLNPGDLKVSNVSGANIVNDTINVYYGFATPATVQLTVKPDPCNTKLSMPLNFCAGGSCTTTAGGNVTLNWNSVTTNETPPTSIGAPGSPGYDFQSYRIWRKSVCAAPNADLSRDWEVIASPTGTTITLTGDTCSIKKGVYTFKVDAIDTCSIDSVDSSEWSESQN